MNSLVKIARFPALAANKRGLQTSVKLASATTPSTTSSSKVPSWQQNFDPNCYQVPLRVPTLDDCMEPYGSWKIAYERERRTGTFDGAFMPNLDNIMEDTEPFNFDTEGRISVKRDED